MGKIILQQQQIMINIKFIYIDCFYNDLQIIDHTHLCSHPVDYLLAFSNNHSLSHSFEEKKSSFLGDYFTDFGLSMFRFS
jgi:hypothetical protein